MGGVAQLTLFVVDDLGYITFYSYQEKEFNR